MRATICTLRNVCRYVVRFGEIVGAIVIVGFFNSALFSTFLILFIQILVAGSMSMFWPNAFDTMNSFYLLSRVCFLRSASDADVCETGKKLRNYNKFNGIQNGSVGEKKI